MQMFLAFKKIMKNQKKYYKIRNTNLLWKNLTKGVQVMEIVNAKFVLKKSIRICNYLL